MEVQLLHYREEKTGSIATTSLHEVTIPQIMARARVPLAAMAHEAGCGPSKGLNWVRVCVSCIKVRNCPNL
jgi:hypothetical protein